MPGPPIRASSAALLWVELALIGAGATLLLWTAMLLLDQHLSQYLAREALGSVPTAAPLTRRDARPQVLARGVPIGELSIPRLHLDAIVLHGSDARTLRRGPGHIEHTALPGEPGNVSIAGHRDTFFRPIRNIRIGDDIFIDTSDGRFRYRVASAGVVGPKDVSVLAPTPTPTLTLITCYPFWVAGPAPDRFVVRAIEIDAGFSEQGREIRR